jgi:hypothetical protein
VSHHLCLSTDVEEGIQHRASFNFELFLRLRNFYCVALFIYREPDHVIYAYSAILFHLGTVFLISITVYAIMRLNMTSMRARPLSRLL